MNETIFVPSGRASKAECEALPALPADVRRAIRPRLLFDPKILLLDAKVRRSAIQKKKLRLLSGAPLLGESPVEFYLDFFGERHPTNATAHLDFFEDLYSFGLSPIPVFDCLLPHAIMHFLSVLRRASSAAILVRYRSRFERDLPDALLQLLTIVRENCAHVDLIIDLGKISEQAIHTAVRFVVNVANSDTVLPHYDRLIVIAGSFPDPLAFIPSFLVRQFPRWEETLWRVLKEQALQRPLVVGDYGPMKIGHQAGIVNSRNMRGLLRYTTEHTWAIVRSPGGIRSNSHWYITMAGKLRDCDIMREPSYSLGDGRIFRVAAGITDRGNPQTWVRDALIQHITFVTRQQSGGKAARSAGELL